MLWVLKRTISMRQFFEHLKHMLKVMGKRKYLQFYVPGGMAQLVSGNRCESDCRSRDPEFDPGPVPYFRGD